MNNTSTSALSPFQCGVAAVAAGSQTAEEVADQLLAQCSESELLWMLDGDVKRLEIFRLPRMIRQGPISAGAIPRLGIPGILFSDGPRGVVSGKASCFPVTMARAATWDPDLEEQVGLAIGREARAQGANYSGAVCINLLRHPGWGRAQECYGEDPVLVGQMGSALTRGLRRNVMACAKHFALNSMENMRFILNVSVDEQALHEVYLPHFKKVVDAGVDSLMSSYNLVNGEFAGESKPLLNDILREEWGFRGFVSSDWVWGIRDPIKSLEAGMDIEMPLRLLRAGALPDALKTGRISRETVTRSARRILSTQIRHAAQADAQTIVDRAEPLSRLEHRQLARTAAAKAAVLLKNEPVSGRPLLPLSTGEVRRLALIGPLADTPNLGDRGSSNVHPPSTCSLLAGLRDALPEAAVTHADGTDLDAAIAAARATEIAIVVVGMRADDEGEYVVNDAGGGLDILGFPFNVGLVQKAILYLGKTLMGVGKGGDRTHLGLRPSDEALIRAVASANPRTAVVVIGGSAIIMESWRDRVPCILMAWYPGMEGGKGIADVLTGASDASGRLPFVIPTDARHLPYFDKTIKHIVYDAWWGQRLLNRDRRKAAYPFGFGLSYTSFEMELLHHEVDGLAGIAAVRVRNTGTRKGSAVAQIYAADARANPPIPQLIGFHRVELEAGNSVECRIHLDLTPIHFRDPSSRNWFVRSGNWHVTVASACPEGLDDSMANGTEGVCSLWPRLQVSMSAEFGNPSRQSDTPGSI